MERVLLLNGNYQPIASVSIQKAANLLIADKVRAVEGVLRTLRTPSTNFVIPTVIALKRFVNVPSRDKKWSRGGVFERDCYTCIFCGITPGGQLEDGTTMRLSDFTIEHIKPVSRGGKSTWGNTACACYPCNHRKANKTTTEAHMRLRWEPKTPRTNYWRASGEFPVEWKKYFEFE